MSNFALFDYGNSVIKESKYLYINIMVICFNKRNPGSQSLATYGIALPSYIKINNHLIFTPTGRTFQITAIFTIVSKQSIWYGTL